MQNSMRFRCIGCVNLDITDNGEWVCIEGKSIEHHKKYCNCYVKSEDTKYDLYHLVTPVVSMILWRWGLNLHGDTNSCIITVYDEEIFKKKLINELLKNGGF